MATLSAVDVTLQQIQNGSLCESTFTFLTDQEALNYAQVLDIHALLALELVPLVNAIQMGGIANTFVRVQARGTTTPVLVSPVGGEGTYDTSSAPLLPPEFALWTRYAVGTTLKYIDGSEETAHPIKRGGAFLSGMADTLLTDGVFDPPAFWETEFSALAGYMETSHTTGGAIELTPAVLGEAISPDTAWRIAPVDGMFAVRITRLRSRLAGF